MLGQGVDQRGTFEHPAVQRLVRLAEQGIPSALLAVGASSAGKTHSLFRIGRNWPFDASNAEQNGIVARVASALLDTGADNHGSTASIRLAFLEVKGSRVNDLLSNVAHRSCDGQVIGGRWVQFSDTEGTAGAGAGGSGWFMPESPEAVLLGQRDSSSS